MFALVELNQSRSHPHLCLPYVDEVRSLPSKLFFLISLTTISWFSFTLSTWLFVATTLSLSGLLAMLAAQAMFVRTRPLTQSASHLLLYSLESHWTKSVLVAYVQSLWHFWNIPGQNTFLPPFPLFITTFLSS